MTAEKPVIPPDRRLICFATCAVDGWVTTETMTSMLLTQEILHAHGIISAYLLRPGDPYLSKVRSKLAIDFLRDWPQATDLFFIDDDVSWQPEKVLEILMRPEDVVAGIYPKKSDTADFPLELLHDDRTGAVKRSADGKLVQANMVPTGFLRIRRPVIEHMANKAVQEGRIFHESEIDGTPKQFPEVFRMGLFAGTGWWGEDFKWCDDWLECGGGIWVDPDILFTHRGEKKWAGKLSDHLHVYEANARATIKALSENKPLPPAAAPDRSDMRPKPRAAPKSKRNGATQHAGA